MNVKSVIKRIVALSKTKTIISIPHPINSNKLLDGKTILIAGGTGGIGLAIARSCVEAGGLVIITGTNETKLKAIIAGFSPEISQNIKPFVLDFSKELVFDNVVSQLLNLFGKIDAFVNAAGVHTENVNFWEMTPAEYDRILQINLKAPYFICLALSKYMRTQKIKGHFLLISSSRGSEPAWSPYGLSKWGLNGLVKGLAQMLQPYGITVNAIAPGSTATPLIGVRDGDSIYTAENGTGRLITPDEIATYACLMISDLGDMLTGDVIHISAGRGTFDIR